MKNNIVVGRNLLETITSALYESPIILFREYVQNSLDAYNEATKVRHLPLVHDFNVKININYEARSIEILDNGYGIPTRQEFDQRMLGFGDSKKTDHSRFIGFRGIGRISALPFCKTLRFENKRANSTVIDICTWEGKTYRDLLNQDTDDVTTFEQIIKKIVKLTSEPCPNNDSHYFRVVIEDFGYEIDEVVHNQNFEQSLRQLLPLKYSELFAASKKIQARYNAFMNEDLSDFMCSVYFNGTELLKNYRDDMHVLDSDLVFWEVREKGSEKDRPGDKIGLLWFTFNKKMTAAKDNDYGIFIRSKNILMGDNDTFADLCVNSKEHVGTYSELTATLRGVYGEFLINSINLKDNARREWFKTDENSIYLKYVIVDFMKRLYKYRYAASTFFRAKSTEKIADKKSKLKNALIELVDDQECNIDTGDFYKLESKEVAMHLQPEMDSTVSFSKEDMPQQGQTKRRNYDEFMEIAESFFKREKKIELFLKLRAFIKSHYNTRDV